MEYNNSDKVNDLCPNCGQKTNSSFSRLVKDACGHMKCRMCLLYEEQGCESCRKEFNSRNNDSQFEDNNVSSDPPNTSSNLNGNNLKEQPVVGSIEIIKKEISKRQLSVSDSLFKSVQKESNHEEDCQNVTNGSKNDENSPMGSKKLQKDVAGNNQVSKEISSVSTDVTISKESETKRKKYNNKNHITIIPGDPEKYQCTVCQKIFRNKKCIHYHNSCATGVKPFQCTLCEKSFINRSHFEYHERTHTGYKPFKCNLCEKAFPQRNKLNRHMISHSNEKNFACSKCNKRYSKKADLQSHFYVHSETSNYKYSCKACDKVFGNISHLKRHSKAHSTERPYICEHCNKSFKDKSLLIRHYKTHGKDRPFTCAHCSRGFLTKSELRRHLTVHSDEKPFSCIYCQTVFRRKDNLNRHIRHHHTEDERNNGVQSQPILTEKSNYGKSSEITIQKTTKTKAKTKKLVPKSQVKAAKVTYTNSQKQINSRLDPMGNITTVIRTTGEVSNAVPVINGPTITRRYTESSDVPKKTLTYMEPIPPEEAVVINKRIEAKLYPQSNISQNYFFSNFSDANDNLYLGSSSLLRSSLSFSNRTSKYRNESNPNCDAFNYNDTTLENPPISVPDRFKRSSHTTESDNVICFDDKIHNNCVSTIKKHTAPKKF